MYVHEFAPFNIAFLKPPASSLSNGLNQTAHRSNHLQQTGWDMFQLLSIDDIENKLNIIACIIYIYVYFVLLCESKIANDF